MQHPIAMVGDIFCHLTAAEAEGLYAAFPILLPTTREDEAVFFSQVYCRMSSNECTVRLIKTIFSLPLLQENILSVFCEAKLRC